MATIYSAVKLEQEQQFLVAKKLQELTGSKNIKLKTVIDESLIAGFSVDFGSAQIDLSVKGQLEDVASDLVSGSASLDLSGSKKSTVSHHRLLSLQRPFICCIQVCEPFLDLSLSAHPALSRLNLHNL